METLSGILISSGLSSRMGDFKPLLNYQGVPFFINVLIKLLQICNEVNLIVGHQKEEIIKVLNQFKDDKNLLDNFSEKKKVDYNSIDLNRVNIIYNSSFEKGMFTSLQTGLNNSKANYNIYHFVDQPHIPLDFYKKFSNQDYKSFDWYQPRFRERNGHPIILNGKVKNIILNASENSNLRDVLKDADIKKGFWKCDYPQILDDIDTPKDYQGLC